MNQGKRRSRRVSESEPATTPSKRKAENSLDEDSPTESKKPEPAPISPSGVGYMNVRTRKNLFNPDSVFAGVDQQEAEDKFAKTFLQAVESGRPKSLEEKQKVESDEENQQEKITPKTARRRKKRRE